MASIPAGLFIHHVTSPRIEAHFERLQRETAGAIDWFRVFNPGNWISAQSDFGADAASIMPLRFERMRHNAGVQNGHLDTLIFPCAATLDRAFVWVMEYDVDFAGNWNDLFDRFRDSRADLLTSHLKSKPDDPRWYHWKFVQAPDALGDDKLWHGFHPLMRLSANFIEGYIQVMADEAWRGHYEFTLPTVAINQGFLTEELGGDGPLTPPSRRGMIYDDTTFRWRPSWDTYFIEQPDIFTAPDCLYHPVKPDIVDWNKTILPQWLEKAP